MRAAIGFYVELFKPSLRFVPETLESHNVSAFGSGDLFGDGDCYVQAGFSADFHDSGQEHLWPILIVEDHTTKIIRDDRQVVRIRDSNDQTLFIDAEDLP
jgi:hypothetical protein